MLIDYKNKRKHNNVKHYKESFKLTSTTTNFYQTLMIVDVKSKTFFVIFYIALFPFVAIVN